MGGFVDQLPALIGVAIGAAATFVAGVSTERARWRHERQSVWDQRRADAYSAYSDALKEVYVQCRVIAANCRGLGVQRKTIDVNAALADLDRLTRERTTKWEAVRIVGDPDTVEAGHRWHVLVYEMERFARAERTGAADWNAVLESVDDCRDRFTNAARRGLGIAGDLQRWEAWGDARVDQLRDAAEGPS